MDHFVCFDNDIGSYALKNAMMPNQLLFGPKVG
jgi:hypothetical protein